jgi:hypothetical protein
MSYADGSGGEDTLPKCPRRWADGRAPQTFPPTSLYRGHQISFHAGQYSWTQDGKSVELYPRDWCGACGRANTQEGHDGCLGVLPAPCVNACCGHGHEPPWVQFADGSRLEGAEALAWIDASSVAR